MLSSKNHNKVTVNFDLLRGCGIPIVPTKSSRYIRERFLPSAVLLKKLPHFGVVEKQKRFILCCYILFILFCFLLLLLFLLLVFYLFRAANLRKLFFFIQEVAEFHKAALQDAANLQLFFVLRHHSWRHAAAQRKPYYLHIGLLAEYYTDTWVLI